MSIPTIQLDTGSAGSGTPGVKFDEIGAHVIVGIVNVDEYHQHNIDGVAQTWSDGTPKMGKRVTGLVVSADRALVGGPDGDREAEPGELVTFYCEGGKHYTWRDAVAEAGGANVGDVMKWTFTEEKPPKQRGYNPQKVYVAQIRRAEARDGDLPARCVEEYQRLQQGPQLQSAPAPTTQQAPSTPVDPF